MKKVFGYIVVDEKHRPMFDSCQKGEQRLCYGRQATVYDKRSQAASAIKSTLNLGWPWGNVFKIISVCRKEATQ